MSCGLVLASISLKDERKKRQQINKKKWLGVAFPCLSILLILKQLCEECQKFSVLFLYTFLSSISFFPHVQMETNVWWHIWGTLKRPGKKGRAKIEAKKRGERKEIGVCVYVFDYEAVCVCACVPASWRLCRCPCCGWSHTPFNMPQKGGIFPSLFQISQALQMGTDVPPK